MYIYKNIFKTQKNTATAYSVFGKADQMHSLDAFYVSKCSAIDGHASVDSLLFRM